MKVVGHEWPVEKCIQTRGKASKGNWSSYGWLNGKCKNPSDVQLRIDEYHDIEPFTTIQNFGALNINQRKTKLSCA